MKIKNFVARANNERRKKLIDGFERKLNELVLEAATVSTLEDHNVKRMKSDLLEAIEVLL